jgi:hypothetical protein
MAAAASIPTVAAHGAQIPALGFGTSPQTGAPPRWPSLLLSKTARDGAKIARAKAAAGPSRAGSVRKLRVALTFMG